MNKILLSALCAMAFCISSHGITYQTKLDTMWAGYRYEYIDGKYSKTFQTKTTINEPENTKGLSYVFVWRFPIGHIRADVVYKPKYFRNPLWNIKLTRISNGDVLYEGTLQNDRKEGNTELRKEFIPDIQINADEYYRVDVTIDNPSHISLIKYFLFQRTSKDIVQMCNLGGAGSHLFTWGTTDPNAPYGAVYDWCYQECMIPYQYQHPCDYFMTIGALDSYMGVQTNGRHSDGDFDRMVLFSVWDNGNTDVDPNLPQYKRAKVYDYNHLAVSGHGGGEGSSGTVMFRGQKYWWRPDHWTQFLINCRPENSFRTEKNAKGEDVIYPVENTMLSVWYKVDTASTWTYMATIRDADRNRLISSWYSFIENFGGGEGHELHRVYYRHGYMRSAASGQWYNRNKVDYYPVTNRLNRTDVNHGASSVFENSFILDYGGFMPTADSANTVAMPATNVCVDTINLDALNDRIDVAARKWRIYERETKLCGMANIIPFSNWTIASATGTNPQNVLNTSSSSRWESNMPNMNTIVFKASEPTSVTSFAIHFPDGYGARCRYVDVSYSDDGENWNMALEKREIFNEDDNDVVLPNVIKATYIKLDFYEYIDIASQRLSISTLKFRGEYNIDKLKSFVGEIVTNENSLQYYNSADVAELKSVYNDGKCEDSNALADAVAKIIREGKSLMCGNVQNSTHISTTKAYMINNSKGQGYICATPDGKVVLKGATSSDALASAKVNADATDPYNSWQILSSDSYSGSYFYNIGAKKYLNPNAENMLSDEPFRFGFSGTSIFSIRSNEKGTNNYYLCSDATLATKPVYLSTTQKNPSYSITDNYYTRPSTSESLILRDKAFIRERLESCKQQVAAILKLDENTVGGIANAEDRELIERLYNGGDVSAEDAQDLLDAVADAEYLEVDTKHAYRFKSYSGTVASTPFLTMTATGLNHSAFNNKADQIWTFMDSFKGKILTSQGYGLNKQATTNMGYGIAQNIQVRPVAMSFPYYLSKESVGKYYLADASYSGYSVNALKNPIQSSQSYNDGALWKVEVVNEYDITLNSAGVASLCVDFDLVIPEDVNVYVAKSVTPDGIIKLAEIKDVIPASTPVLIKGEALANVSFTINGHEAQGWSSYNLFSGSLFKNSTMKKNTYYVLKSELNVPIMKLASLSGLADANEAYIVFENGMPELSKYTFDFNNLVDDVKTTSVNKKIKSNYIYDALGRKTNAAEEGFYISRNKKYIK